MFYNDSMSFYDYSVTQTQRNYYERLLKLMGSLSHLYSDSKSPFLVSRVTENLFCRCLGAENLSRSDITADAKKEHIGIGIKTWTGSPIQKVAEFNKLKSTYDKLDDVNMILRIAELRNERIDFTKRTQNLDEMIYHCTIRTPGEIHIIECPLENIVVENIRDIHRKSKNVIAFTDGINSYSFNTSKSTLYKDFTEVEARSVLPVEIIEDPFLLLEQKLLGTDSLSAIVCDEQSKEKVYLPLYSLRLSSKEEKVVAPQSGLNQGFADGRKRSPYEVYVPIPKEFYKKYPNFFPPRKHPFSLRLPNDKVISASVCQDNGKALMSNPNSDLGEWLFNDVFHESALTPITYEMLEKYGIDAVEITKNGEDDYSINFAKIGSYERFMRESSSNMLSES